jgi:hypothetical protein
MPYKIPYYTLGWGLLNYIAIVPDLPVALCSAGTFIDQGYDVVMNKTDGIIVKSGDKIIIAG